MELNCKNYYKQEKDILNLIETSDYISFDLEMTGMENDKNNCIIDTPEYRYLKYKKTTECFSIIRLGLSFFKLTTNPNIYHKQICYDCHPYNLYLFPNAKDLKDISQDELNLEVQCMHAYKEKKIDFNKWINEGIQYLNEKQYRELYKNITENNINNDNFEIDISHLRSRDLDLAKRNIENIKNNFINKGQIYNTNYVINCLPKYILYYIKKNLPNNLYYQENSKFNKSYCTLIIGYKTKEEKNKLYMEDILNQLKELNHKKGAKRIIDAIFNKINLGDIDIKEDDIINNKKKLFQKPKNILIGHNMYFKLMFLISKLGDTLPNDYMSFKNMIKDKFDSVYDTKFLFEEFKNSDYCKNKENSIDNMYKYLNSNFDKYVKIKIKPNDEVFKDRFCHSSGYDSFITGACFLYIKSAMKNTDFLDKNKNQIYLINSLYKSININKDKDDYIIDINKCNGENIYVFKGDININELNFEIIFDKKLWDNSVIKTITCEKNNSIIIFTNFDNKIHNENKNKFINIAFNKLNNKKFTTFTLTEYRNKYMK